MDRLFHIHVPSRIRPLLVLSLLLAAGVVFAAGPVKVVAAENFYGNIVQQIGGDAVRVTSVMSDPNVDPHEYESNVEDAVAIAGADLVVENGGGYDDWMDKLLSASPSPSRIVLKGFDIAVKKLPENEHVWYDVDNARAIADVIASSLGKLDPAHASTFKKNSRDFGRSLAQIKEKMAQIASRSGGTPVGLTETIFLYQTARLGLKVLTPFEFQKAIAEGNDPPADTVVGAETQIKEKKIRILIYNEQTVSPITTKAQNDAKAAGIPVVGVTETMPQGETYQEMDASPARRAAHGSCCEGLMSSPLRDIPRGSPDPNSRVRDRPVVSADHVRVVLGGRTVLRDVSFQVEDGELVAILGPNGAGKSTLLKLLLGLVKPSAGRLTVLDQPPGRENARIGYVPQFRAIEGETTLRARDVVRFGLDGHKWGFGWPSREREKLIDDALDEVDGKELANAAMGDLSGGERQRLLVAQALLSDPRLLLLDEPLASLDIGREQEIIALIQRICRSRAVAVLFVTHDVNPLLSDLDRVLYLAEGKSALGTAEEVITTETLSTLYGAPVEVVKTGGRLFVVGARI